MRYSQYVIFLLLPVSLFPTCSANRSETLAGTTNNPVTVSSTSVTTSAQGTSSISDNQSLTTTRLLEVISSNSCQKPSDCETNHTICVRNRCRCIHGYYPHYDTGLSQWSCLAMPVGSICCIPEFTALSSSATGNGSSVINISLKNTQALNVPCEGGDDVCRYRMGELAVCNTSKISYGSCQCTNPKMQDGGFYDMYEDACAVCRRGNSVNGSCTSLLDEYCDDVSDQCTSHIGYHCSYNYKCSCAPGYQFNCDTKRCVRAVLDPSDVVECPHIIQAHVLGNVSCDKRSGCWKVLGSKGITVGCVDMLIALLPGRCGITCKLQYQGIGECEETSNGVVCFSCFRTSNARLTKSDITSYIMIILLAFQLLCC